MVSAEVHPTSSPETFNENLPALLGVFVYDMDISLGKADKNLRIEAGTFYGVGIVVITLRMYVFM